LIEDKSKAKPWRIQSQSRRGKVLEILLLRIHNHLMNNVLNWTVLAIFLRKVRKFRIKPDELILQRGQRMKNIWRGNRHPFR
jgi:hypothetical protein